MPMSPGKDESESDFISRCVSEMADSHPDWDNDRHVAACYSMWREGKKSAVATKLKAVSPTEGEGESAFIGRCVKDQLESNPNITQDDAIAVCYTVWRNERAPDIGLTKETLAKWRRWVQQVLPETTKRRNGNGSKERTLTDWLGIEDPDSVRAFKDWFERLLNLVGMELDPESWVSYFLFGYTPEEAAREVRAQYGDHNYGMGISISHEPHRDVDQKLVRKTHISDSSGLEFVLSDATPDRFGDVIIAEGWDLSNFKRNPIALFNHNKDFIVGKWNNLRVVNGKLRGYLQLAPEGTSDRIDEIRKLVEADILKAVSVGFRPLESTPISRSAPGEKYLRSELMETSLVAIPANPNALSIAKSLHVSDDTLNMVFAKYGSKDLVTKSRSFTGEHAESNRKDETKAMTAFTQRIQDEEERIVKLRDQLTEHVKNFNDEDPDETQTTVIDDLTTQIERHEKALKALKNAEKKIFSESAAPVTKSGDGGTGRDTSELIVSSKRPFATPAKKISPVDHVIRALVCEVHRWADKHSRPAEYYLAKNYGENDLSERTKVVLDNILLTRAAVAPATTTTTNWAAELVQTINMDFLETLMPASVYPGLSSRGMRLTFGNNGVISIPSRDRSVAISGSFVGQGSAIPVRKTSLAATTLTPKKMGVISTFTRQIAEHSIPSIETLIRNAIQEDTAVAIDTVLIDTNAATAIRPAGVLNGVTGLTATTGGGITALVADVKALTGALVTGTNGNLRSPVWLMNPAEQLSIALTQSAGGDFPFQAEINQNRFQGYPVIISSTIASGTVILLDAADFVSVTGDAPRFDVSDQAVLHEEDTSPTAISAVATPNTVAAPVRSLWQTDTLAIRMLLDINWALVRTGTVAFTTSVTW